MKSQSEHYDEYYDDVEKSPPFINTMDGGKSHKIKVALVAFKKTGAKKILENRKINFIKHLKIIHFT
ncbi:MAG: hypothetical protein KAS32_00415 [Candidatus Peribacteraceae bacterium]|nr:hypothetical protein [Candidatus Peribacteraceae bacterium]